MSIRIRKTIAAAFAVAPLVLAAPAGALSPGQTVCYAADGSYVVNPPSEEGFEYCVTREASGGSDGGNTPYLCDAKVYHYGYNDGLGSTGPYDVVICSPIRPLGG
jgi:hypothetical protein